MSTGAIQTLIEHAKEAYAPEPAEIKAAQQELDKTIEIISGTIKTLEYIADAQDDPYATNREIKTLLGLLKTLKAEG